MANELYLKEILEMDTYTLLAHIDDINGRILHNDNMTYIKEQLELLHAISGELIKRLA